MASNSVNGAQHEPLLHAYEGAAAATVNSRAGGFPWLKVLGSGFLTVNSGMAIYRSRGKIGEVTFVQILVWAMAAFATVLGGFYAFFIYKEKQANQDHAVDATPRVKTRWGFVLAAMRWRSPGTDSVSRAHDPRDSAWSGTRLIVDSGATSHAVGNISLLEGFQPYRPPLVAILADGSSLRILGAGHIQRGRFRIPNVSLVQGLQDGLISTQQLDDQHNLICCFANGVCRIMQADGSEVGGAILDLQQGGYVLTFLDVPGSAQE